MKLIRGPTKKDVTNKIECDECGRIYECKKKELELVSDWRDGDFYWFKCPGCKTRRAIAAELIK